MMEYFKHTVGYLYVNYSHTNNCYWYVKLILKKKLISKNRVSKYYYYCTLESIHLRIELTVTRRNTFNVRIATAINI